MYPDFNGPLTAIIAWPILTLIIVLARATDKSVGGMNANKSEVGHLKMELQLFRISERFKAEIF